ncbi:hypothetical protein ACA097_09545 [Pseudomonas sp. QL9]|uniref:hypothetical protein n=1 Tax=Pseudomonas sp. QL9 TaxID=3242725 RepID=UPI00352B9F45
MSMNVAFTGFEGGAERFGIDPKTYARMEINSINRAGRRIKRDLLVEPMSAATGVKRVIFNDRIAFRPATSNVPMGKIVPSSHGIPARSFRHRSFDPDSTGTRAKILVAWWNGEKVAAGFINPLSKRRLPLATRSEKARAVRAGTRNPHIKRYRYSWGAVPQNAQAPSAAALMGVMMDDGRQAQAADILAEEFNIDLDKVLF